MPLYKRMLLDASKLSDASRIENCAIVGKSVSGELLHITASYMTSFETKSSEILQSSIEQSYLWDCCVAQSYIALTVIRGTLSNSDIFSSEVEGRFENCRLTSCTIGKNAILQNCEVNQCYIKEAAAVKPVCQSFENCQIGGSLFEYMTPDQATLLRPLGNRSINGAASIITEDSGGNISLNIPSYIHLRIIDQDSSTLVIGEYYDQEVQCLVTSTPSPIQPTRWIPGKPPLTLNDLLSVVITIVFSDNDDLAQLYPAMSFFIHELKHRYENLKLDIFNQLQLTDSEQRFYTLISDLLAGNKLKEGLFNVTEESIRELGSIEDCSF